MQNVKVMGEVLFVDYTEDYSLGSSLSDSSGICSEEVRGKLGYTLYSNFLLKKEKKNTCSQTSKYYY